MLYTSTLTNHDQISKELLRSGDARAVARAISTVENHAPGWIELLKEFFPHSGHAVTIGLTGSPGAGKSTLVDQLAKLYSGEVAVKCANECVQIHGGYGFIKDYPAEKYYRDVKLCTIGEGTSEIQRLVIARQVLKD